jgi:hypothetical protein
MHRQLSWKVFERGSEREGGSGREWEREREGVGEGEGGAVLTGI